MIQRFIASGREHGQTDCYIAFLQSVGHRYVVFSTSLRSAVSSR